MNIPRLLMLAIPAVAGLSACNTGYPVHGRYPVVDPLTSRQAERMDCADLARAMKWTEDLRVRIETRPPNPSDGCLGELDDAIWHAESLEAAIARIESIKAAQAAKSCGPI